MTRKIVKNIKLFREFLRLRIAVIKEYPINLVSDLGMRFLEFGFFFIMWKSIFGAKGIIPGWDIPSLMVLYSFESLFIALLITFTYSAIGMWKNIHEGRIDKYLCRPTNPWFMVIGERMGMAIGGYFVGIGGLVMCFFLFDVQLFQPALIFGLILVLLATAIATLFCMIMATMSFWFGKIEFIDSIFDSLMEFDQFPQNIFPWQIQTALSITLPFLFAHTIPTLSLFGKISLMETAQWIVVALGVVALNYLLFSFLWNRGLKRYEAHGG